MRTRAYRRIRHAAMAIVAAGLIPLQLPAYDGKNAQPRVETYSRGDITVTLTFVPPRVELDKDILLSAETLAPSGTDVVLPPLEDRLEGFLLSGTIEEPPVTRDGKTAHVRRMKLTPLLASEYRVAPIAVSFTDHRGTPPETGWFATRAVLLDPVPPITGKPADSIRDSLSPAWIYPSLSTVAFYIFAGVVALALLFLLWKGVRKIHRHVQLMRMSPKERALRELAELLARGLVTKNLVKEFYLELTLIVRTYIERAHAIRAPEQTTEEFLTAVSRDPRFGPGVVRKLKTFLEAADLVKFADDHPESETIQNATSTAREYIESDADMAEAERLRQDGALPKPKGD